jgi:hypothetical protein
MRTGTRSPYAGTHTPTHCGNAPATAKRCRLALYIERGVKPRRIDWVTRIGLTGSFATCRTAAAEDHVPRAEPTLGLATMTEASQRLGLYDHELAGIRRKAKR